MSKRVHELAKELKVTSKELIEKLQTLGVDAKSHMGVLTEANIKQAKEAYKPAAKTKAAATPAKPQTAAPSAPDKLAHPGSIASVRQEFLLQRGAAKAAQPAPQAPKSRWSGPSTSASSTASPARRPFVAPPKSKSPVVETKKPAKPAFAEKPAAAFGSPAAPTGVSTLEAAPEQTLAPAEPRRMKKAEVPALITVKDLASRFSANPSDLIARLIKLGIFANINQSISFEIASKVAQEFGYELEKAKAPQEAAGPVSTPATDKARLKARAPIVTFMGHVDHGKTSLLDAIRKTKVAAGEAGGITQHIGAYQVFLSNGAVTFLDTPGHEAFTAMRARGARVTDVVVLVVAADDGVMPQTIEAIDHAKAAGVTLIVAINKMDLPSANPDRARKTLMEHGLMSEEWGGKTIMMGVSAKTGKGIDELLEMLALESDLLELKADPAAAAKGIVIEAALSKDRGVLATVLVQDGTLRVGDVVIAGPAYCKVRAMTDDRGQRVKEAPPSMPVEILGLPSVPKAGDRFYVVKDERKAKEIMEQMQESARHKAGEPGHITLEQLYQEIKAGKVEELKLIIKSDVQGSVEALRNTLGKIQAKNVGLNIIHSGTGEVSESDVMLAAASDAVVIGFHVGISDTAKEAAEQEKVDVRFYDIIYEAQAAIEKAMEGLLEPELKEIFLGAAEVRQVFKVSKVGTIAGCVVQKGKITRNLPCRVTRAGAKIHEGKIESLKRFKDDAREVLEGFECGIGVSSFDDFLAGDRIEAYEIQKKERKLE